MESVRSFAVAIEIIDHVEETKRAAIAAWIVHEIHRPRVINRREDGEGLRRLTHQTLLGCDAQGQCEEPRDAVHAFTSMPPNLDRHV